jgi:hypothetical protein
MLRSEQSPFARSAVGLAVAFLVNACASGEVAAHPASHPASPNAEESPTPTETKKPEHGAHGHDSSDHTTEHDALYTCPMHADVTSKTPGNCPKCGMTLRQKKP